MYEVVTILDDLFHTGKTNAFSVIDALQHIDVDAERFFVKGAKIPGQILRLDFTKLRYKFSHLVNQDQ